MRAISKALAPAPAQAQPVTALPCRIRSLNPCVIDFYGTTTYPATVQPGGTYTVGAAMAFLIPGAKPMIIQFGG